MKIFILFILAWTLVACSIKYPISTDYEVQARIFYERPIPTTNIHSSLPFHLDDNSF